MDDGFLADSAATGFVWLGVLGVSALAGAWGTRQAYRRLAGLVEPFRDQLVVGSVGAALRRSTARGAKADTAGVARLTQQVEIAREAYGAALMSVQAFLVISVSAMIGLLTLAPAVVLFVLPPVVVGLALFLGALGRIAARQRDSILAEEGIAEDTVPASGTSSPAGRRTGSAQRPTGTSRRRPRRPATSPGSPRCAHSRWRWAAGCPCCCCSPARRGCCATGRARERSSAP